MDSTTLLYKLIRDAHLKNMRQKKTGIRHKNGIHEVRAISFDYGQRHKKELRCAARICKKLGIHHTIVNLGAVNALMKNSALTSRNIPVPDGHYKDKTMRSTVVPNRNMVFIALAVSYAVSLSFSRIALAVHAGDHAIYPDCRPVFIKKMRAASRIANYEPIAIYAPFLHKTKIEIAQIGRQLGVPFKMTWTCYKGGIRPCGTCGACVERNEALRAL